MVREIRNRLTALGLQQVMTYSLTSEELNHQFVMEDGDSIVVADPMSEDKKEMRKSLIPSLMNVYQYNTSRNIKNINIFETGSVYYKKDDYIEESKVAGLLSGEYLTNMWQGNVIKVDFYFMKGVIENLLLYLGYNNRYSFGEETLNEYHPGISCSIKIDNEIIGYMGKVNPTITNKDIYVFELSLDKIMKKKVREIKYKEISKYPSVNKDVAFIVNKDIKSEEIMKILKRVGGRLLESVDVFDLYEGENIDSNKKSLAYSLVFKNNERTLTDEEVTNIFNKMIEEVETKLSAELRNK